LALKRQLVVLPEKLEQQIEVVESVAQGESFQFSAHEVTAVYRRPWSMRKLCVLVTLASGRNLLMPGWRTFS